MIHYIETIDNNPTAIYEYVVHVILDNLGTDEEIEQLTRGINSLGQPGKAQYAVGVHNNNVVFTPKPNNKIQVDTFDYNHEGENIVYNLDENNIQEEVEIEI